MQIKKAEFIQSNTDVRKCPDPIIPEYAFIGRSNVGKSSLINTLTERSKLAKTSNKPGKTQLINHFRVNKEWYLVDLPGYGYAKTSKKNRNTWQEFIQTYFIKRTNLLCTFVLLDSRHPPQKIDLDFMEWMGIKGIPFNMVFTKIDKLSSAALNKNLLHYQKEMLKQWESLPPIFRTSSETKIGRKEILDFIEETNKIFVKT